MITREDAERLVGGWAERASETGPYEMTPMLREFEAGFVVWLREPPSVMPEPGDGTRTVVDRHTGALSTYPALPIERVMDLYRERVSRQPAAPSTVDQAAQLRRSINRLPAPAIAAHLTLVRDRKLRRAFGAKGDQELNHHHLTRQWLEAQPPGHLVRGVERHAELLVISDVLHEYDAVAVAGGGAPVDLQRARKLLSVGATTLEVFHVREREDELAGTPALICQSCLAALAHFGVRQPRLPRPPNQDLTLHYGCYVSGLAVELRGLVTMEHPQPENRAERRVQLYERKVRELREAGGPDVFPAAWDALMRYGGLQWERRRPGEAHRVDYVDIGKVVPPCRETLASFGQALGVRLYPIGVEGLDRSILAVDEQGRVFAFDQGGEWYIGANIDEAACNLIFGRPQLRVRDDRTW